MFHQTFSPADLATIAVLIVLEGVLSIDNALVLGILAGRLDKRRRMRALSYGLIGAFVLRLIMIAAAAFLLKWSILKLLGGLYLVWVAVKHFWFTQPAKRNATGEIESGGEPDFWRTVLAIELTDVAFAVDSILAAVALVGPAPNSAGLHPKLWVIVTGGMIGVILMRFAAAIVILLLDRFSRLNQTAYWLVILIGLKLIADWAVNSPEHPDRIDFQDPGAAPFWVFWLTMAFCLGIGLIPRRKGA